MDRLHIGLLYKDLLHLQAACAVDTGKEGHEGIDALLATYIFTQRLQLVFCQVFTPLDLRTKVKQIIKYQ